MTRQRHHPNELIEVCFYWERGRLEVDVGRDGVIVGGRFDGQTLEDARRYVEDDRGRTPEELAATRREQEEQRKKDLLTAQFIELMRATGQL